MIDPFKHTAYDTSRCDKCGLNYAGLGLVVTDYGRKNYWCADCTATHAMTCELCRRQQAKNKSFPTEGRAGLSAVCGLCAVYLATATQPR